MFGAESSAVDANSKLQGLLDNRYRSLPGRFFIQYWRFDSDQSKTPEHYFSNHLMTDESRQLSALITRSGEKFAVEIGSAKATAVYGDDVYWDGTHSYNYRRAKGELFAWPAGRREESPAHIFLRTNTDFGSELLDYYIRLFGKESEPEIKLTSEPEDGNTRRITIANHSSTLDITFFKLPGKNLTLVPFEFVYVNERTHENARYKNIFSPAPKTSGDLAKTYKGFYREVLVSGITVIDCFKVQILDGAQELSEKSFVPRPKGFVTVTDLRLGSLVYYYSVNGLLPIETVRDFKENPDRLSAHQRATLPMRNH